MWLPDTISFQLPMSQSHGYFYFLHFFQEDFVTFDGVGGVEDAIYDDDSKDFKPIGSHPLSMFTCVSFSIVPFFGVVWKIGVFQAMNDLFQKVETVPEVLTKFAFRDEDHNHM